ncbi:FAD-dependent monooxygenase [Spongisporangium articulatum]|uniref:FAD-dependent monooxygenase n=1 Tax=Spongisporangium articulatum TaxID=3362603 RepID=A0ABW8ALW7_9ACTN
MVIGAGPTGATLALLLAAQGVASIVLERRTTPLTHPAAHVVNARSFEIWNSASPELAARIAALAPPEEEVNIIRWCGGLDAEPLGEIDLLSEPDLVARVKASSPFLISHIGQHQLMPVLWEAVQAEPLIDLRLGHEVTDLTVTPEGTVEVAVGEPSGASTRLAAPYAVSADGANSRTRDRMGFDLIGPVLATMGSVFFHAPGLHRPGTVRPLLTWIYQPSFCGVMIAHADDDYILMTAYLHPGQSIARQPRRYWERTLPKVLGDGVATTIRSTSLWTMNSQVAEHFRSGPVFLAGDAAHRFPHTGGYGLNSGVQDAHNLAWKLAAVLDGSASESLLDTYEPERRPVVELFARQSTANHFLLDEVTRYIGVTNKILQKATGVFAGPVFSRVPRSVGGRVAAGVIAAGQAQTSVLASTGRRGRKVRDRIAAKIMGQAEHFVSSGLELGYAYGGPLICTEPGPQPVAVDDVVLYRPTTWPGARLPHARLRHGGAGRDAHDLLAPQGMTLFTADPPGWRAVLGARADDGRYPPGRSVRIVGLDPEDPTRAEDLVRLYEVGARGAVLVRPDGHVMWRTAGAAEDAGPALHAVLQEVWDLFFPGESPARPAARKAGLSA